jgi:predicted ribonuclease toxin of YeeF-YezG toxin-antitoxin module
MNDFELASRTLRIRANLERLKALDEERAGIAAAVAADEAFVKRMWASFQDQYVARLVGAKGGH